MITELVLRNSGGELARHEIEPDEFGEINLPAMILEDSDLRLTLEMLHIGDTLSIEERWTER